MDILIAECVAQRDRLLLWCPLFLAIGIGTYYSLQFEPPHFIAYGLTLFIGALWGLVLPLRQQSRGMFSLWLGLSALTLIFLGFSTAQLRTVWIEAPMLEKSYDPVTVEGVITVIDKLEEGSGTRIILEDLAIEKLSPEKTPRRVRLKVRSGEGLHVGDHVRVLAGLKPPSAPVAPGAFDFQRYAYFKGIGAFGFTYRTPEVLSSSPPGSLTQRLEVLRETIKHHIEKRLPKMPDESAVATALMTGERTAITESDWEALRGSGLSHMMAISGLHVGLVAGVVFMTIRLFFALFPPLVLRYPVKKWAALAALLAAVGYTLLVGATIPTIRAAIMTGIVLFAVLVDRMPFSMRLVAIAAFVVLLALPDSLFGASFQMSFAAVGGLIFFYEQTRPLWTQWHRRAGAGRRILLYFVGVCFTTIIATLATTPLSLYHFQHHANYCLLANIFAVPTLGFIVMPAAVFSYALMPLGLDGLALVPMGWGIRAILEIAHGVTDMPLSVWTPPVIPLASLLLFASGVLFAMLWVGRLRIAGIFPVILSVWIAFSAPQPGILVSPTGKLVGLRDQAGQFWVSTKRTERFTSEVWARRNGVLPEDVRHWRDNDSIRCDELGCRAVWNGRKIAYSTHAAAQQEDCAWADVLISAEPLREKPCKALTSIGFFDLWRNGAYAIWADGWFQSVEDVRGQRPWTVSNRR